MNKNRGEWREEGRLSWFQPADTVHWRQYRHWQIFVNQGWRQADLVGNSENLFLFRYTMPNEREYLAQAYIDHTGYFSPHFIGISAKRPPVRWREALENQTE